MSIETISGIALALCLAPGLLHSVELLYPTWGSRFIVNWVLPFFDPSQPNKSKFLSKDEQLDMLDGALASAPKEKETAAKSYIFLLLFEQRQGALAFNAVLVAILYAFQLPLAERTLLHFFLMVMSAFFALVNANQAGLLPFFGKHPRVAKRGITVGYVFTPFWLTSTALNYLAFAG